MHYRYGNDAIVDLRTPRRVQSRRLLGALTFDVHAEMKSFHENPLRVWVRDVSLKCQNSIKSRFRKVLTSTFHLACVLVNSKTSSKRRHRICYIDRTSYPICFLKFVSHLTTTQVRSRIWKTFRNWPRYGSRVIRRMYVVFEREAREL